jgi:hypothetical protein
VGKVREGTSREVKAAVEVIFRLGLTSASKEGTTKGVASDVGSVKGTLVLMPAVLKAFVEPPRPGRK